MMKVAEKTYSSLFAEQTLLMYQLIWQQQYTNYIFSLNISNLRPKEIWLQDKLQTQYTKQARFDLIDNRLE